MQTRNAARVLPDPVGAAISVWRAAAISRQPAACGSVGPAGNRTWNQARTAGWNDSSTRPTLPANTDIPLGNRTPPPRATPDDATGPVSLAGVIPVLLAWLAASRPPRPADPGRTGGR